MEQYQHSNEVMFLAKCKSNSNSSLSSVLVFTNFLEKYLAPYLLSDMCYLSVFVIWCWTGSGQVMCDCFVEHFYSENSCLLLFKTVLVRAVRVNLKNQSCGWARKPKQLAQKYSNALHS